MSYLCCAMPKVCCATSQVCCVISLACCAMSYVCCTLPQVCCATSQVCCEMSQRCCAMSYVCCTMSQVGCAMSPNVHGVLHNVLMSMVQNAIGKSLETSMIGEALWLHNWCLMWEIPSDINDWGIPCDITDNQYLWDVSSATCLVQAVTKWLITSWCGENCFHKMCFPKMCWCDVETVFWDWRTRWETKNQSNPIVPLP